MHAEVACVKLCNLLREVVRDGAQQLYLHMHAELACAKLCNLLREVVRDSTQQLYLHMHAEVACVIPWSRRGEGSAKSSGATDEKPAACAALRRLQSGRPSRRRFRSSSPLTKHAYEQKYE